MPYRVDRLNLTGFRNHPSLRLESEGDIVVLTGQNGAGKTNILEAISLLSPGKGLRNAKFSEMICSGSADSFVEYASSWVVNADVQNSNGCTTIGTARVENSEVDKRIVKVDGKQVSVNDGLSKAFSLLWLTPQMSYLFTEGASERRKFFDRIVYNFDSKHASRINSYEQAMRERNRLLKEKRFDNDWLSALEAQMAERGIAISQARIEAADRVNKACMLVESEFPKAKVEIVGEIEIELQLKNPSEIEESYKDRLRISRKSDSDSGGRTSFGCHRSDISVIHLTKGLNAVSCSTGEQKAMLIAIIIATARAKALFSGAAPVLLLDEVVAHLDESKREALLSELADFKTQIWITGTEKQTFDFLGSNAHFYEL